MREWSLSDKIDEYIQQVKTFTSKHQYWDDIMEFRYIKTLPNAKAPEKVSGNACYDLSLAEGPVTVNPGERVLLRTGLILIFPDTMHGKIRPRSGLAWKYGIDILAGMIDNSFEQETMVVAINHGEKLYTFNEGDRIAQIKLEKDYSFPVKEVTIEHLKSTGRGSGFGSSGT